MKKYWYCFWLCLFSPLLFASIYSIKTIPNIYQYSTPVYVANPDGIISPDDEQAINSIFADLEAQTTIEVAVVAVESIGDNQPRAFANELFNYWEIGKADQDNGLLILLVVDQREVVFETGYGMESILPDILCNEIQQQYMVPDLKENRFSEGLLKGSQAVSQYLISPEQMHLLNEDQLEERQSKSKKTDDKEWGVLLGFCIVFLLFLTFILKTFVLREKDLVRRAEIIRGLSPIFVIMLGIFLFVISGTFHIIELPFEYNMTLIPAVFYSLIFIYTVWLKRRSIVCPKCQKRNFKRISRKDEELYMSTAAKFEANINSVKYAYYQCQPCQHVFRYKTIRKNYSRCHKCHVIALKIEKTVIIKESTYSNTGMKQEYWKCLYCQHSFVQNVVIPKLTRSSSGSSSSGGSSSSSRGGGSSGGGGSSSGF